MNNYVNEIDQHIDHLNNSSHYETFNPKSANNSPSKIKFSDSNNIEFNTNHNKENISSYQRLISQLDDENDNEIFLQTEKALQEIKDNFNQSPIRIINDNLKKIDSNNKPDKNISNIEDLKIFSNESKSKYKNEINNIEQSMRRITYNDGTTDKLKQVKSKFEESKSKINKKLEGLVSFLNEEENKTEQDIATSFLDESKIMDTHKIDFNLEDLKNYDHDSTGLYCNNNALNRAGSSTN